MNYNIINDYIVKIPKNNPYNRPKIESIKVIVSNNNLVENAKLIIPLINTSLSITGQYPSIIKAQKSVASFKLRKGSPVGLITTIRGEKLENYLKVLNSYILPRIATTKTYKNLAFTTSKNSTLTLGVNNLGWYTYITPLEETLLNTIKVNISGAPYNWGGYNQVTQSYAIPKQYKGQLEISQKIHKYYLSSLYFPMG